MSENVVRFPGHTADVPLSEDAIACQMAEEYGHDLKWCPNSSKWYVWNGVRWAVDKTGTVPEMARNICRLYSARTGQEKWARRRTTTAVEAFCRTHPGLPALITAFDADPQLLGTKTGTVNLATGEFRAADRKELITKSTLVDPSADDDKPDRWLRFLHEVTGNDQDLILYLQKMAGYALTGHTQDHSLFFVYGPGGNGKGTFLDVLRNIMGNYAVHAPISTFTGGIGNRHPTELAMLRGARLVTASETEQGEAWAESRIKELTGGDPISARFMREDFFTFIPAFKLVIVGNHRPVLQSVDDAARRRFRIIPFIRKPVKEDKELGLRLRREYPAILRWMIAGCVAYHAEGMGFSETVRSETFDYFEEQDAIGLWLSECCEVDEPNTHPDLQFRSPSSKLFASWSTWAKRYGERSGTNKGFSESLRKRGFAKHRTRYYMEFIGLRVRSESGSELGV